MAGLPPDSRYVTGGVPAEMREGVDLIPGVEVAASTERAAIDVDGVSAQISQLRFARPDNIPAGPLRVDDDLPLPRQTATRALRYDFPLFPDVQVRVSFEGNATADHLEQLVELLTVQCSKLRTQEQRRRAEGAARPRTSVVRKIKPKKGAPEGDGGNAA